MFYEQYLQNIFQGMREMTLSISSALTKQQLKKTLKYLTLAEQSAQSVCLPAAMKNIESAIDEIEYQLAMYTIAENDSDYEI